MTIEHLIKKGVPDIEILDFILDDMNFKSDSGIYDGFRIVKQMIKLIVEKHGVQKKEDAKVRNQCD